MTGGKNLVLIGYRGTGKSTIAAIIAKELGLDVIGIDAEIVARVGHPIPQIVEERGWDAFRDMEASEIERAAAMNGVIIDCGGGAVLRDKNVAVLKAEGVIFLLEAGVDTIAKRIQGDANRPSLTGKGLTGEIAEVLLTRRPLYNAAADHRIATDNETPENIARIIAELFRSTSARSPDFPGNA